jgi:hypothetical protein
MPWFLVEFIIGGLTLAVVYCIWRRLQEIQITTKDDEKAVGINEETGSGSILADRLGKLDAATQGWKKRVGPTDAVQFSVAGRMMMEHTKSSLLTTCASDVTLTPTISTSPPVQLLGHSSADRKRRTPRAERFRSKAGKLASCTCSINVNTVAEAYHSVLGFLFLLLSFPLFYLFLVFLFKKIHTFTFFNVHYRHTKSIQHIFQFLNPLSDFDEM